MKTIVIYFSAETGKTRKIAEELAKRLGSNAATVVLIKWSPEMSFICSMSRNLL